MGHEGCKGCRGLGGVWGTRGVRGVGGEESQGARWGEVLANKSILNLEKKSCKLLNI